jgi:polar amino acid transport system substrate-binding protein
MASEGPTSITGRWWRNPNVESILAIPAILAAPGRPHSGSVDDDGCSGECRLPEGRDRLDRQAAGGDRDQPGRRRVLVDRTEAGYAGVPVDLGEAMAAELGVPVEYVAYQNSGQITDSVPKGNWDVTFLPKDPERETRMSFGPIYEVADATYIVKPGSSVTNFAALDQPGIKVAAVNNTTTMRGAAAHLKNAKVAGYQTYDEIFGLLKNGEVDAFALSRDQLNAMARKIPGTRVPDETFKQTVTAVAVPLNHPQSLAFATKFMTDASSNGTLRKAYDNNGLKDTPIRAK